MQTDFASVYISEFSLLKLSQEDLQPEVSSGWPACGIGRAMQAQFNDGGAIKEKPSVQTESRSNSSSAAVASHFIGDDSDDGASIVSLNSWHQDDGTASLRSWCMLGKEQADDDGGTASLNSWYQASNSSSAAQFFQFQASNSSSMLQTKHEFRQQCCSHWSGIKGKGKGISGAGITLQTP